MARPVVAMGESCVPWQASGGGVEGKSISEEPWEVSGDSRKHEKELLKIYRLGVVICSDAKYSRSKTAGWKQKLYEFDQSWEMISWTHCSELFGRARNQDPGCLG